MKKQVFILLALCFAGLASAQNINRFEYFFDTDPGVGASTTFTNITPTTLVTDLNIPIATTSLLPGFHTLYIRSRNDLNQWTHTHFRNFFVVNVPAIGSTDFDRVEYFIDTDPGVGLATAATGLTPDDVLTNFPIDISAVPLTAGFHTFYVRAKTSDGQWTHTHFRNFFVDAAVASPPTIANFSPTSGNVGSSVIITGTNFSTTPANNTVTFNGVEAIVTSSTATSLTVIVPAGTTTGPIRVTVSGLNVTSSTNFSLSAPIISAAEYFFNTDPGPGNGISIPLTPLAEVDLPNLNFITTSLPVGWHTVHVRAKDTNNTWGFYESRRIYIREPAPTINPEPPIEPITAMEFFYNTDNGPGTGTPITITSGPDVDVLNTNFANTLPVGWHTVHVRTKNNANTWGFYESRRIYVREPTPTIDPEPPIEPITAMEFFYNIDNGPGTGTPITITSGPDVDVVNTNFTNTLPVGWHTVHVRTKNALNTWGFYESRRIYIREGLIVDHDLVSPIAQFEYFVDTDPGVGLSTFNFTKPDYPKLNEDLTDEPLNVGLLSLGAHKIFIRAKNQNGEWGLSELANFTVVAPCSVTTPPTITTPGLRCDAGSVNLVAAGASVTQVYRWYTDATTLTILATTATGTYTTPPLTANTNFYVTIYDPATFCESARTQVAASISGIPKPALNINGSLAVCEGTTQNLQAPLGFTNYEWSNGIIGPDNITVITSGSYTVKVSNAFCSSPPSDPFVFTVNAKPTKPTVNATGGGSLCSTGSVTLTAPAGFAGYSWSSGQSTQPITVNTIGNFSVRVTNASGCQSDPSDVFTVTSGSIPKPVITPSGSTDVCGSGTVRLTAPAGYAGYSWSNTSTAPFIDAPTGTYTVTVSDGNCNSPSSDPITVTTASVPSTPSIVNTGVSSLCTGTGLGSFTVLEAPAGFSNYLWSTNETTRQIIVTTPGSFTVQVGNSTGCLSAQSAPTLISPSGLPCGGGPPVVTAPTITNGSICNTGTVLLTASGATGGQVYRWYSGLTGGSILFTGASFTTPTISATTIYYASNFDASIPAESSRVPATATIVNYAAPTLAGPAAISICAGTSATLSAPTGFLAYKWSDNSITQQIQPTTDGSYSVQVGEPGCLSPPSNAIVVTVVPVIPKPTITVTGNTILCGSSTVELSAPPGFTYNWATPFGSATTQNITASTAGNYSVTVSNGTCSSPASDVVNVTSVAVLPKPTITVTGSTALCNGGFAGLSAPLSPFYLWSNGSTSQEITVTTAGNYTVQIGNASNCLSLASDATVITQTGLPCPGGTGPNPPTVTNGSNCGTGTVILTASGASGTQEYRWYNVPSGGTSLSSASNYTTPTLTTTATFYSTIFDAAATPNESVRIPVTATIVNIATPVLTGPSTINICAGGITLLTAPTGFVQYKWSDNSANQTLPVSVAGNYSVQVGDGSCLSPSSNTIQVNVSPSLTKPVIVAGGSTTLCGGTSVTLTAPAGFTYNWSTPGGNETTSTVNASAAGNYLVTVSDGICSATSDPTIIATAATPPKPTITVPGGNTSICGSGSVKLSAPVGYATYEWSNGETTREIFADADGSYKVVGRNAAGCPSPESDPQLIVVKLVPTISFSADPVTVGTSTTFIPSATDMPSTPVFTWVFGDGNSTTVNALQNVMHTYTNPGLYFAQVTLSDGAGCEKAFTRNVTVNALAGPGGEVINFITSPVCKGQATTFTDLSFNLGTGATYAWDFENDGINDNNTVGNVQHTYSTNGTYDARLTITLQSGTVITKINQVVVNNVPLAAFIADAVCANTPTTFTEASTEVLTGATYQWDFNNDGVIDSSVKGTTTFSFASSGTYTTALTINNGNGCTGQRLVNVQVGRVPFAQVMEIDGGGLPQLCAGSTLKLKVQAEAGASYTWKKGVDVVGTNANELIADAAGNYTVSISNTCGTVNAFNTITIVSVVPPVAQTISLTGSNSFCESESVLLTVPFVPGISYQWQIDNSDINGATGTILFASSSGKYSVITSNSCGSVASNMITLNQLPKRPSPQVIEIVGGQAVICAPDVVTLRVPQEAVVDSYQWRRNGLLISSATANEVSVGQSGVYTVEIINSCSTVASTNAAQITVNTKPIAQLINANRSPLLCPGENVLLAVVPENGVSYQWIRDNNIIAGETAPQLTAAQSGQYKLLLSNSCQSSLEAGNSIDVLVTSPPSPPTIFASGPTEICATEGSVLLSTDPIPGVVYQWQRNNNPLPFTNSNSFQATLDGTYSVKVNNTCSIITSSNSIIVTLLPSPLNAQNILVQGALEFCSPGSVILSVPIQIGASYQWRRNVNTNVGVNAPSLEVTQSGVYDLVMTNGCRPILSLNSIEVKVNTTPVVQSIGVSRSTDLCEGDEVTLSVQLEPNTLFQWKKDGLELVGQNSSSITVNERGQYNVTLSNSCGSIQSNVTLVSVLDVPIATDIENLSSLTFCEGGSVQLRVPYVTGQNYQWKRDGNDVGINTYEYLANQSGKYSVALSNRCFSLAPSIIVEVTKYPIPAPPIMNDPTQANPCDPRTWEITVSDGFASYDWYFINGNTTSRIVNQKTTSYRPVATGQYKVVGTDVNGCSSESLPKPVIIEPVVKPNVVVTKGKISKLDSLLRAEVAFDHYQWYVNNKYIVGATQRELTVFYNGTYTLAIINTKGCRAFSEPVVVNEDRYKKYGRLSTDTSDGGIILPTRLFDDVMEVFPNPTSNGNFDVFFYGSTTEGTECIVYDQWGREILSGLMTKQNGFMKASFDVSEKAQGIYLIRIRNRFMSITQKLIKE